MTSKRFERLDDWLIWLEGHHPVEIELGLGRIRIVADRLGLLNPRARIVTIGGTNGKGSCVAVCSALLRAAGWKVGSYISPHILSYNERVCVNGQPVSDAALCEAFARIDEARGDISLTYFEFGTLAAFEIFRDANVDVMVLEVGLGGRLDAVNLLDADVAVVTSVDLDHQSWLGNDRDSIGREKAGIYRTGRPGLCADPEPPLGLLDTAAQMGVTLQCAGDAFGFKARAEDWCWWGSSAENQPLHLTLPVPLLPWSSVAAALQAVAQLGVDLPAVVPESGLEKLTLRGRFQQLSWRGCPVILDVAHNPAAARHLAERLARHPVARTFVVVGIMADKDRVGTLAPMKSLATEWWLAALPGVPRAASPEQLKKDLAELGAQPGGYGTVPEALRWLELSVQPGDRIVFMGSFFTVSAALVALNPGRSEQKRTL